MVLFGSWCAGDAPDKILTTVHANSAGVYSLYRLMLCRASGDFRLDCTVQEWVLYSGWVKLARILLSRQYPCLGCAQTHCMETTKAQQDPESVLASAGNDAVRGHQAQAVSLCDRG